MKSIPVKTHLPDGRIAKDVFGAPVKISVETTAPAVKEKPVKEDPVLKAFQKHLGGEVVETRRSK